MLVSRSDGREAEAYRSPSSTKLSCLQNQSFITGERADVLLLNWSWKYTLLQPSTYPWRFKEEAALRARKPRSSFQLFYDLIHRRLQLSMSACSSILSRAPCQVDTRNVLTSQQADHIDHQARRWSASNTWHSISSAPSTRDTFFCQLGEVQLLP